MKLLAFQGEHHLAVGCVNGIYVRNRDGVTDSPFRSVLKINTPISMAAFPEFNEFLVHYESTLYSYPLDLIVRGDSTPESLDKSKEKLAEGHGDILFFKAGCVSDRMSIVYAAKNSEQVILHVLELTHHWKNGNQQTLDDRASYRPLGYPMPISEEPHDATFFLNKVAICASKAIYIVEPMNARPSVKVVPEFLNSKSGKNSFLGGLNGTLSKVNTLLSPGKSDSDPPSIIKLAENAKVLGLAIYGSKTLIVYDELGCFIDENGNPGGSRYYTPWECTAGAYAHRGPHLLLFSSEIIEVRSVDTGKFIQIVEISHLRPLRCGLSEQGMLVAAMGNDAEGDEGHTEKLVEVAYNGK